MAEEKVAFAERPVTVHVTLSSEPSTLFDGSEAWDIESKILLPGETMPLSEMPPYLRESIKLGQVPGLKAMTPAQAQKTIDAYNNAMGFNSEPEEVIEDDPEFPAEEF